MYSAMVDDITFGFFGDITITTMLPPDDGWTKSGLLGDIMEDCHHHIRITTDSTVIMVLGSRPKHVAQAP